MVTQQKLKKMAITLQPLTLDENFCSKDAEYPSSYQLSIII